MTAAANAIAEAGAAGELGSMRHWVFEETIGKFDIDLGDSHVQCSTVGQFQISADLELNYGFDRGSPELIRLVAQRYGGSPEHVVITHGAQEALYLLYCTLLRPGDRVIAFRPGWQQAWQAPQRLGCRVEVMDLAEDFSIDLAELAEVDPSGLRLITVNSPTNPTGRRIRAEEFTALLELAERADAYLVVDEEYLLDLSTSPAVLHDRAISVSSLSKTAGVPGLRVGWMYGPPEVVSACAEYKHLTTISNSVLCEALAADVLRHWDRYERQYQRLTGAGLGLLQEFTARHSDLLRLTPPEGTPFAWLRLLTGGSSMAFARQVLETGVLLMPAETLGTTGGIRISFAREPAVLAEGLARIEGVLTGLTRLTE
ncbi:MAG TPA: pyridoxal phosphate-dependent aminotransferase [Jatrophihabitans sp.]|jgi:aspartate/methionine/tyrosine aminotransferase|uniref:pyridoxal phosphate-dependent aminotransferase n=1 Tax=Jatrophihabitans sp. TaxID=1932789 RepID=UPI002F24ECFC